MYPRGPTRPASFSPHTPASQKEGEGLCPSTSSPTPPTSILTKRQIQNQPKKKGQIKSNKVMQLIIILIDSSEFTARPRKVEKGGQRGRTWGAPSCPSPSGESKEPPAKFSFSHLLLFFFLWGILSVKNMTCLYGAPTGMKL